LDSAFKYRIAFLGCPSNFHIRWNRANLQKLRDLGFNCAQLSIAWGARPGDEPLNLEDVVDVRGTPAENGQGLPLRSGQRPDEIRKRRENLRKRIARCKEVGLRTLFHFGAPYNMHARFGDSPPNCLSDPRVIGLYVALLEAFAGQFPGVDDLQLYTYDQDAWLCSEFGLCPRCLGVPLHERVSAFVNRLAETWQRLNPDGRLWWEPWELSAGQVFRSIGSLNPSCVGLALHSNIAEVMATMPVDRWLKNTVAMAKEAGLPVVVEHFLGGPTEEVEPFQYLTWPLVTWRGLRSIAALDVDGIKEYYGTVPTREDANLSMTSLFFADPGLSEEAALRRLAAPYGKCADDMILFWRACSEAMELFPWESSWFIRQIGRCDPVHRMSAAFIRGQQAHTPSWESTRRAIFMKTDSSQPDPWLLEDVQLRCNLAAERMERAVGLGKRLVASLAPAMAGDMKKQVADLSGWRKRALSYVYHIRETNLTLILRRELEAGRAMPERLVSELKSVLTADMENQGAEESCRSALRLFENDPRAFVQRYFAEAGPDQLSKGMFTLTSR
jgi:hypothetical protein